MKTTLLASILTILPACIAFSNHNFALQFSKALLKPLPMGYASLKYCMNANNDDMSYLDKLGNQNLVPPSRMNQGNVKKLASIQNNITKYMQEKNKKSVGTSFTTKYNNPIPRTGFDNIFLNINNITAIYISSDYDRAIFQYSDARKFVFYINRDSKKLVDKIINIVQQYPSQQVKIIVICDKSVMTDPFGYLYCEK
jgi:hypothetical protein